ncbi:MbnP family protein [Flavobacterium oreochromis]|uniref:MbnP family protein n=1 Tax=Flavobacterium oreochromis TaxID=2906078 RepID=UPI00385F8153
MKNFKKYYLPLISSLFFLSCSKDDDQKILQPTVLSNNLTLVFENSFKNTPIILGEPTSATVTTNTSVNNQKHLLKEVKYIVSNIRLIAEDGTEVPYNVTNLDLGATIIDQAKPETLNYVLLNIPYGTYKQIKFGLGVTSDLNKVDQTKAPKFFANAGENKTQMMWEWGAGYRFVKIEGYYGDENKELSIHTGSTQKKDSNGNLVQGVDAYRDITLRFPNQAVVGKTAAKITINADFDKLLSGTEKITLTTGTKSGDNATPNIHSAVQMMRFVNNIGGNGTTDIAGMFSVTKVQN